MRAYHSLQSYAPTVSTTWSLGTVVVNDACFRHTVSELMYPLFPSFLLSGRSVAEKVTDLASAELSLVS